MYIPACVTLRFTYSSGAHPPSVRIQKAQRAQHACTQARGTRARTCRWCARCRALRRSITAPAVAGAASKQAARPWMAARRSADSASEVLKLDSAGSPPACSCSYAACVRAQTNQHVHICVYMCLQMSVCLCVCMHVRTCEFACAFVH